MRWGLAIFLVCGSLWAASNRIELGSKSGKITVEFLDDETARFSFTSLGEAPSAPTAMVARSSFTGPTSLDLLDEGRTARTPALEVSLEPDSLCFRAIDRVRNLRLGRFCPTANGSARRLTLDTSWAVDAFGLGQQFRPTTSAGPSWAGSERTPGNQFGNHMTPYFEGATGNTQIPVIYVLGEGTENYAIFLDNVYAQRWNLKQLPWSVDTRGGALQGYLFSGSSLDSLRKRFVGLVGHAPVPPKKMFGLWISEYGYRNWEEVRTKLKRLRDAAIPVDGFVLDLYWFGGIETGSDTSAMGRVDWDRRHFPDPEKNLRRFSDDDGVGIIPIEEPYVSRGLPEHSVLESRGFLAKDPSNGKAMYLTFNPWWGKGGMIDWSNPGARDLWHTWKRAPLAKAGVAGHWLDLGEPEAFDDRAHYLGGKQADVHNLYNFQWVQGVRDGYAKDFPARRSFVLTRSGTAGIQRFGTALWSGDIGSDLESLRSHFDAQVHMSLSGIDYFGADIGGFHRAGLKGNIDEMYTQWFASGMLFDIPGRPHTENLCRCKETSPAGIGDVDCNRFHAMLRYSLIPYIYSLSHAAHQSAEPIYPPLFYYDQADRTARKVGNQKLLGKGLMAAGVAKHGARAIDVYFPKGRWFDFYTGKAIESRGEWVKNVALYPDGKFRLPLYAREGALIPRAFVDAQTWNSEGLRADRVRRDDLVVRAYPGKVASTFRVVEDDGKSTDYRGGRVRVTTLQQRRENDRQEVEVSAAVGTFAGASSQRNLSLEMPTAGERPTEVRVDGQTLTRFGTAVEWKKASSGWYFDGQIVHAKAGARAVEKPTSFTVDLAR